MRRKKSSAKLNTVSLFPFLAVLICTFGVLIILLVIVVKAAEVAAEESDVARQLEQQQEIEPIQQALDLQLLRVEGLRSIRPALLNDLKQEKNQRAHLQADINSLADKLQLLSRQFDLLKQPSEHVVAEQLQQEVEALTQQLADERDLLAKRRQAKSTSTKTKYSVVPYDGPGGTKRRPIYIECREAEIILQPYGIRLGTKDFVAPILPNNPLDAALIAVREYFLKRNLGDEQGTPYPLLIVRPNGPNAYGLARHAMKSWDEEFGYELIAADKELEFGYSDPQLEQEIRAAVAAAKSRQQDFLVQQQLIRTRSRNQDFADPLVRNAGGLQASSQFGGFVAPDGRVRKASGNGNESLAIEKPDDSTPGESISNAKRAADIALPKLKAQGTNIAADRGKDWALPSKSNGAVAYRRPVKIFLAQDQLIIDSDSRSNRRISIAINDNPMSAVEQLVEAIWERIDTWGVAGVGGYWKPELGMVVLPGSEIRYRQISSLLQDSGFDIKENQQ